MPRIALSYPAVEFFFLPFRTNGLELMLFGKLQGDLQNETSLKTQCYASNEPDHKNK